MSACHATATAVATIRTEQMMKVKKKKRRTKRMMKTVDRQTASVAKDVDLYRWDGWWLKIEKYEYSKHLISLGSNKTTI